MSFAYDVKAELCKVPINRSCCAVAEGCGVLLYASAFTANEVRIVTENDEFAARLPKLFQKAFSLRFDELPDKSKDGGKLVFRITQEDKLDTIWRALGYDRRAHFALHLNFALLEEEWTDDPFRGKNTALTRHYTSAKLQNVEYQQQKKSPKPIIFSPI